MNKSILILSVFIIICLNISVFAQNQSVVLCQTQVQKKQFDEALKSCEEAIKVNPAIGTMGRGMAYAGKAKYNEAINDFSAVINLNPQMAMAFMYRGSAYQQKGDYKAALNDYERASSINPQMANVLNKQMVLVKELYELSNPRPVSKENVRTSLDFFLKANELMIARSLNVLNKKPKEEIETGDKIIFDNITRALQYNPYNGLAYKSRGDFNKTLNKNESAMIDYTKALVLEPKNITIYKARADLYLQFKNYDLALADYNKMIELSPTKYDGYFERAGFYDNLKKDDLALADYAKIIELEPKNTLGYSSRIRFYFRRNQYDSALPDIKQLLVLQPNDANGRYLSCQYFRKKSVYNEAIKDCTIAVNQKAFIISGLALLERSEVYLLLKKYDLALADLAAEETSEFSSKEDIAIRRGKIYLAQGKKTEAIAEFNKALKENPKSEDAKKELGKLGVTL